MAQRSSSAARAAVSAAPSRCDLRAAALGSCCSTATRKASPSAPRRSGRRGAQALALNCDVTDAASCADAIRSAVERFGGVDVLVNNAGITHRSAFATTDPAVLRRVMEVNFFGAMNLTHHALPHLLRSRGAIVAISSVAGFAPLIARTGYAASKHALHGFFESLRSEVRSQGVDVTLVCPSFIAHRDRSPRARPRRPARAPRAGRRRPAPHARGRRRPHS